MANYVDSDGEKGVFVNSWILSTMLLTKINTAINPWLLKSKVRPIHYFIVLLQLENNQHYEGNNTYCL